MVILKHTLLHIIWVEDSWINYSINNLEDPFLTPSGAGGSATRNEYGWYAQSQIRCD